MISVLTILGMEKANKKGKLESHLNQLLPGSGKSLVTCVSVSVLALVGYNCYCPTSNKKLNNRDLSEYGEVFDLLGLTEYIQYDDITTVYRTIVNKKGPIEKRLSSLIKFNSLDHRVTQAKTFDWMHDGKNING